MDTIKKVIYFDESTAMDFLQIEAKGKLTKTTELMSEIGEEAKVQGDVEMSVGKTGAIKTIFEKLTGFGVSASITASGEAAIQSGKIAKTILENTLLYDFIDTVEIRKKIPLVDIVEDYTLVISENSMTYFAMIAPISEMMEGSQNI